MGVCTEIDTTKRLQFFVGTTLYLALLVYAPLRLCCTAYALWATAIIIIIITIIGAVFIA